jgi:hypothetical protein
VGVVPDASDDGNPQGRNHRDAIRSRPGIQNPPGFQRSRIDPGQAGASAIRDQHTAFAGDDARCFRKAVQCSKVLAGVGINHLEAVSSRVCNENAAGLGFESPVVECRAKGIRYLDGAC